MQPQALPENAKKRSDTPETQNELEGHMSTVALSCCLSRRLYHPVVADSTFLWTKDEESLAPRTTPVNCRNLLVSGLTLADSGAYECAYDDGSKARRPTRLRSQ